MRTPAGTECKYYYEDFHRGREKQECRLIQANRRSLPWEPGLCAKCPVPEILRANGSPNLRLELTVRKKLGLFTAMDVEAHCSEHGRRIDDPIRGCAECALELRLPDASEQ
ncbi:MAG: hypothetical protein ACK2T6_09605 [Anaerolineae bacterium]